MSLSLTSCGGVGGGETVDEPTTEQMSQYESKWGMQPRKPHSRTTVVPAPSEYSVPQNAAPPVQAVPTPPSPAPQPIAPDPEPPRLDAGTIRKLQ